VPAQNAGAVRLSLQFPHEKCGRFPLASFTQKIKNKKLKYFLQPKSIQKAYDFVIGNSCGPLIKATRLRMPSLRCFYSYCCTKSYFTYDLLFTK
jgi:hypothetical protein